MHKSYLNIGAGYACAGHNTDIVWLASKLNNRLFSKLGNFGDTFPIGSEANVNYVNMSTYLPNLSSIEP